MAVEPEDDELLLDHEAEEQSEAEEQEEQAQSTESDEDEEETVISFGDEPAPGSETAETPLIKHLREQIRERDRKLAEVSKAAQPQKIDPGPKPTLESCDYDEEAFEQRLDEWKETKRQAEQAESEAERSAREAAEAWQTELRNHEAKKASLKFPDVQETEELVVGTLNPIQRATIIRVADNSALVMHALGKNPAKLAELSQINDPLKAAAYVAKLEGTLKVTTRRKAPEPEQVERGSARIESADKTLERLEKEAERTGDRTKLVAYKRQLKSQGKA